MKKLTFLLGLMLACLVQVQAQKISGGIKAGVNGTTWGGDATQSVQEALSGTGALTISPKAGFHVGGFLSIPVTERLLIEPGLYYSTKGLLIEQTFAPASFLKVRTDITNESHYIDFPVVAKVTIGQGFQLYAGPQVSYLAANKVNAEAGLFGLSYEQDFDWNMGLRKFDFALTGGVGYQFHNGVQLNLGYDHGLSSLDEGSSNFEAYNRAVKFSVGYRFR